MTNAKSLQLGVCVCLLGQLLSERALAEAGNAAAQLLFEEGRELLQAGNVEEACPKLEESVRLEVATGALLALATCHEKAGKLATAWGEYERVARRAAQGGQAERERWARERVAALRPLLSTLNVQISDGLARLPGLQVRRDEQLLDADAWNVPVPVDGGTYRLRVTAPAHEPWETTLVVQRQRDVQRVQVPLLRPVQLDEPQVPQAPSLQITRPHVASLKVSPQAVSPDLRLAAAPGVAETSSLSSSQRWGVGLLGVSLASFATSGVMLYRATTLSGKSDSALAWGDGATYFAVGGGVLAAVGAGLLIWGGEDETKSAAKLHFAVSPQAMAVGVDSSF